MNINNQLRDAIACAGPLGRVVCERHHSGGDPGWNREQWTIDASGAVSERFDGPGPCDSMRRTPRPAAAGSTVFGSARWGVYMAERAAS